MTRQTSFQLTEATEGQLDYLKQRGFGGTTDVIRIAIDRMAQQEGWSTMEKTYYDRPFTGNHDSPIRTAVVEKGMVIESFVWQPHGNLRGFDGPDPDDAKTIEDLKRLGYTKRR